MRMRGNQVPSRTLPRASPLPRFPAAHTIGIPMTQPTPDLAIILVSWNTRTMLLACLAALPAALSDLDAEIWVVDNGSHDGSVAAVAHHFPAVHIIANAENRGFAAANNQALQASSGRYALLLNSDTIPYPGSIAQLVRFADSQPRAGLVGGLLLNPDGSFQYSFANFPSLSSEILSASGLGERLIFRGFPSYPPQRSQHTRQVDVIPGACMLARRSAFSEVGMLDEAYFMYSEEPDWCLRMQRAGWQIWYVPAARIMHYGGESTRQVKVAMVEALYRSKVRFFRKHYRRLYATIFCTSLWKILWLRWIVRSSILRQHIGPPMGWRKLWGEAIK
ncbi:MAG: glycosyltransferase family 2 protein [Candidatus Viridilinea halotolerans]|uniref:Glycosyltransferase family 2 protein n=1 Tax=Candidatus Viridilinea halotolerans TaxID=2491704 RepID=A0A426U780_9CHLR|nr:MAG: glycosyltransferase family 2 protein [Candidatus Viridilinea halotolerans]